MINMIDSLNLESLSLYSACALLTYLMLTIVESRRYLSKTEQYISLRKNKIVLHKSVFLIMVAYTPMWFLIAFRNKTVGIDAGGTYYRMFLYWSRYGILKSTKVSSEISYMILNKLCLLVSDSYHLVLIVTGSITWFLLYRYIIKNSPNPSLSFLILFLNFFYFHQFNVVRQFIAMGIILQGFHYIKERKILNYSVIIILAMTFHKTAIIAFLFYFLYDVKLTFFKMCFCVIGSKIAYPIVWYLADKLLIKTRYYKILYSVDAFKSGYAWADMISNTVLLLVGFFVFLHYEERDKDFNFNLWLQLIGVMVAINSNKIPIPYRILWYANINTMVFVPMILNKIKIRINYIFIKTSFIAMYLLYFLYDWWAKVDYIQEYSLWK